MADQNFGQRLKQIRQEHGRTQQQVATDLFVSRQTVSSWETGRNLPDLHTVQRLAKYYNVSVDDLLDGTQKQFHQSGRPMTLLGPSVAVMVIGRLAFAATSRMLILSDILLAILIVMLIGWWRRVIPVQGLRIMAGVTGVFCIGAAWMNLFAMDFGLQLVYLVTAALLILPVAGDAIFALRQHLTTKR